ncbi:hypothetical protein [Paenibacillus tepidiphilus]|uniref:hypothetical protein n=1 Tax=Paenibacillus tepidiphilus TaxID=2608683 RepID=UPI00123BD09B|nr:hypothetical protein [Paenibacillus tepidiphilus]
MPIPISASLIRSIAALPHHALVIDDSGMVLHTGESLQDFSRYYGLPSAKLWIGQHYSGLLHAWTADPSGPAGVADALQPLLQDLRLVAVAHLELKCSSLNTRYFRLEAFPLLAGTAEPETVRSFILSLEDLGAASSGQQPEHARIHSYRPSAARLIPICASCKSIRNRREEWVTMEHFLQKELSLQFTHDICPDCIRQLYPRYAGAFSK